MTVNLKEIRWVDSDGSVDSSDEEEIENPWDEEKATVARDMILNPGEIISEEFFNRFSALSFCKCGTNSVEVRMALEGVVIEQMKRAFPPEEYPTITVLSVGPGKCLQELVYVTKLHEAGYRSIRLILVDPAPNVDVSMQHLEFAHRAMFPEECELEIVRFYPLADYQKAALEGVPQLFLFIDLDDVLRDYFQKLPEQSIGNLTDHSYLFLSQNELIPEGAVIGWTLHNLRAARAQGAAYFPSGKVENVVTTARCGRYEPRCPSLQALGLLYEESFNV